MNLLLLLLSLVITAKPASAQCFMETESGAIDLSHLCNQQPRRQQPNVKVINESESYQQSSDDTEYLPEYQAYPNRIERWMWEKILQEQQKRVGFKVGFRNGLTFLEIKSIIGFEGELVYTGHNSFRYRWQDGIDPNKKIEITFVNRKMMKGSATGL